MSLNADADATVQGASARVHLQVSGFGADQEPAPGAGPSGRLPETGTALAGPLLLAALSLGLGMGMARMARDRPPLRGTFR